LTAVLKVLQWGEALNLAASTWNYLCAYGSEAKLEQAIREIVEDGFGVELWLSWTADPEAVHETHWDDIRGALEGADVTLHTGLGRCDEELFRREVDMAVFLGADLIVTHESTLGLRSADEPAVSGCCRDILDYARSREVRVALENGTFETLEKALALVEDLGICLDIGHANIDERGVGQFLERFGAAICHVHLSDNYGQTDNHLVPGDGYISMKDWRALLKTLHRAGFSGTAVLELNTAEPRKSAKRAREFLDYAARSVDEELR